MTLFEKYHPVGQNNITTTANDLIATIGIEGIKAAVGKVMLGGNVRDITVFITQRRLLWSYAATLDLFVRNLPEAGGCISQYTQDIMEQLIESTRANESLYLWLLGLTKKGRDNIVRSDDNFDFYRDNFSKSVNEVVDELGNIFGDINASIRLGNSSTEFNWQSLSLLFLALGSQTLSIRGSAKSMNGKLFEKLVLGVLLCVSGFDFKKHQPERLDESEKCFWLSHTDENEREIDGTVVHNGLAISIDIGFIGKGNPEISLDKVTRFGSYKEIGGIPHNRTTIIIVDTVGEGSDLFSKAQAVGGHVIQMKDRNWVAQFIGLAYEILKLENPFQTLNQNELTELINQEISTIDIEQFI